MKYLFYKKSIRFLLVYTLITGLPLITIGQVAQLSGCSSAISIYEGYENNFSSSESTGMFNENFNCDGLTSHSVTSNSQLFKYTTTNDNQSVSVKIQANQNVGMAIFKNCENDALNDCIDFNYISSNWGGNLTLNSGQHTQGTELYFVVSYLTNTPNAGLNFKLKEVVVEDDNGGGSNVLALNCIDGTASLGSDDGKIGVTITSGVLPMKIGVADVPDAAKNIQSYGTYFFENFGVGNYIIGAKDDNGVTATCEAEVVSSVPPMDVINCQDGSISVPGASNGVITFEITGLVPPANINVQLLDGNNVPVPNQSQMVTIDGLYEFINLPEGFYGITVNGGPVQCGVEVIGPCHPDFTNNDCYSDIDLNSPDIPQIISFDKFMGINLRRADPIDKAKCVGTVREYHEWNLDEIFGTSYPENNYQFHPTNEGMSLINSFDMFYGSLRIDAGVDICATLLGSTEGVQGNSDEYLRPPSYLVPNNDYCNNNPSSYSPLNSYSYEWRGDYITQFVNRYGGNPSSPLNPEQDKNRAFDLDIFGNPTTTILYEPANNSTRGLVQYVENWNEQDNWFIAGEDACFTPEYYALMSSIDYDGVGPNPDPILPNIDLTEGKGDCDPQSFYNIGLSELGSDIKYVMGGLSKLDVCYLENMANWFSINRGPGFFPFDVLNFHNYSNEDGYGGLGLGVSPEEAGLYEDLKRLDLIRDNYFPGKELWLSEFGYNSNPNENEPPFVGNDPNAAGISNTYLVPEIGTSDRYEVQGQWIVRSFLAAAAADVDKAFVYEIRDNPNNQDNTVGEPVGSWVVRCGLLQDIEHNYEPKKSWYYTYSLKNILTGMDFISIIDDGDPHIYHFSDGAKDIYAIWSPTSDGTEYPFNFTLPGGAMDAYYYKLEVPSTTGIIEELQPNNGVVTVPVSERPIFLVLGPTPNSNVECVDVSVESKTCSSVTLTWEIPLGQNYDHYQIWYGPVTGIVNEDNPDIFSDDITLFDENVPGGFTQAVIGNLLEGVEYYFYVIPHIGNNSTGWCMPKQDTPEGDECNIPVISSMVTVFEMDGITQFTQSSSAFEMFDGTLTPDAMHNEPSVSGIDCCYLPTGIKDDGADVWFSKGEMVQVDLGNGVAPDLGFFDIDVIYLYDGTGIGAVNIDYYTGSFDTPQEDPNQNDNWDSYVHDYVTSNNGVWIPLLNDVDPCQKIRFLRIYTYLEEDKIGELVICGKPYTIYDIPNTEISSTEPACGKVIFSINPPFDPDLNLDYQWDFGDGMVTSTEPNPEYTYGQDGIYNVTLTISALCGDPVDFVTQVEVTGETLTASFASVVTPCTGEVSFISNQTSQAIHSWDFGDGTGISTNPNPEYTYSEEGTYIVTHTVQNDDCEDETIEMEVVIPEFDFEPEFNSTISPCSSEVSFTSLADNNLSHSWIFEGAMPSSSPNPEILFPGPGTYEVILQVSNDEGCDKTIIDEIIIEEWESDATIIFEMLGDCFSIDFTGQNAVAGEVHEWNFGDNNTSNEISPSYTYSEEGTYTVIHTVTNDCGVFTDEETITIADCLPNFACPCPAGEGINLDGTNDLLLSSIDNIGEFISNRCIAITGKLIVDQQLTVVNGNFIMNPGSEIEVSETGRLVIATSDMAGCTQMWEGIKVKTGGKLTLFANTIQDARYAVEPEGLSKLLIKDNTFDKNYVGIYTPFIPYDPSCPPPFCFDVHFFFEASPITGNRFISSGDFLPPPPVWNFDPGQIPYAGIELNSCWGWDIGASNMSSNRFIGLRHGIVAKRSILNIRRGLFQDIIESSPISAVETIKNNAIELNSSQVIVSDCVFENCTVGVQSVGSNLLEVKDNFFGTINSFIENGIVNSLPYRTGFNINNNILNCTNTGIKVSNGNFIAGNNTLISDNVITLHEFEALGIRITNTNKVGNIPVQIEGNDVFTNINAVGISVVDCENISVSNDNFIRTEIQNYSENSIQPYGIQMRDCNGCYCSNNILESFADDNSSSWVNEIGDFSNCVALQVTCNDVSVNGAGHGFLFWNNCEGSLIKGNTFNLINQINDLPMYGLRLNDAIIGNQPPNLDEDRHGNMFLGLIGSGALPATYYGNFDLIDASRFRTHTDELTFFPFFETPLGQWFIPDVPNTENFFECGPMEPPFPPDSDTGKTIKETIAMKGIENAGYGKGSQWIADRKLFKDLENQIAIMDSDILTNFSNENLSSSIHDFYEIDNDILEFFATSQSESDFLFNNLHQIRSILNQIDLLNSLIEESSSSDSLMYVQEKNTLLDDLTDFARFNEDTYHQFKNQRLSQINQVIVSNEGISTEEDYELNLKTVNDIYLKTILQGDQELSLTDRLTLRNIADICPQIGGDAVYKARAILPRKTYNNNCNKDEKIEDRSESNKTNESNTNILVYPNPASNSLNIQLNKQSDVLSYKIILSDLFGKEVLNIMINREQKILDISILPEGLYICNIYEGNKVLYSEKVVVIR